jgi:hypothetical protein
MSTEEQQPSLERALGRVEGTLAAMAKTLEDHTKADGENFEKLSKQIAGLDVAPAVRRIAWKWAASVAAIILTLAQIAQALGLL